MALAQLSIDLVAKLANFERDTKRVGDIVAGIAKTATVAFAAVTTGAGTAIAVFDQLVKSAGNWQDIAEKTGGTAEGWASMAIAAGEAGAQMEAIASASVKLTASLVGVDDESKAAGAALTALGIPIEQFKQLKPEDQLEAVAKAMAGFKDGTDKTAVAVALFGKSGAEMLPFLKALGAEQSRQAILTKEQIEAADAYADRQSRAQAELKVYAQAIATQALPALTALTGALTDTAKDMLGVGKETAKLGADKGVATFAVNSVKFLGYVVDAADGVVRIVTVTGKTLGALGAAAVAVVRGEFGQVSTIFGELGKDVDAELNRTLFSDRLQKRLAEVQAAAAGASTPGADLRFGGRAGAGAGTKAAKAEKDAIDESSRALARYVQGLADTLDKTEELTEAEKARRVLQTLGATGEIEQVRTLVQGLAEQIDKERELAAVLQLKRNASAAPGDDVTARNVRFQAMVDATPTARLEKQRAQMVELAEAFQAGAFGDIDTTEAQQKFSEVAQSVLGIGDAMKQTGDIWQSVGRNFAADLEDAIVEGKSFTDVLGNLGNMIQRVFVRQVITGPLESSFSNLFSGFSFAKAFGFADGGVMTPGGPLPLRAYAQGGVASSPQLALYGEGSMNEAYVPLPDGRRIPVALQGNGGGQVINITINNTLGSVASREDVISGMQVVRNQIMSDLSRSKRMNGAFA